MMNEGSLYICVCVSVCVYVDYMRERGAFFSLFYYKRDRCVLGLPGSGRL